jgi:hypothetical protein
VSSSEDMLDAVDALILPTRKRVHREDKTSEYHAVPSLWDQLIESADWKGQSDGGGVFGSRPVVSTGVVALVIEIADAATEGAVEHVGKTRGNTPDNIRAVTATITDKDQVDWWVQSLKRWAAACREVLQLDPPNSRSARKVTCPSCGESTWFLKRAPKEYVRIPALAIVWQRPPGDDYHADSEWRVQSVDCRACNQSWERGNLHMLMDQVKEYNLTRETMTDQP